MAVFREKRGLKFSGSAETENPGLKFDYHPDPFGFFRNPKGSSAGINFSSGHSGYTFVLQNPKKQTP